MYVNHYFYLNGVVIIIIINPIKVHMLGTSSCKTVFLKGFAMGCLAGSVEGACDS